MIFLIIACLISWFACGEVAFILAQKEPSRLLYKYRLVYLFGGLISLITVLCSMIIEGMCKK